MLCHSPPNRPSHSPRHVKAKHKQMRLVEEVPGELQSPERSMEIVVVVGSEEKGELRTSSLSRC